MTRMINGWTNTEMWVADDRVEEYKAAGWYLPPVAEKPTVVEKPKVDVKETKETKKATKTTKTTTKKK